MTGIKVSIVVPVYNVEQFLPDCLDSLTNQTLKDIEIICVNDGSPDNSLKILEEYAQNDDRVKIITQENQGVSAARNAGLKTAVGEYIGFVDPDDWIDLDFYSKLYDAIQESNADISVATIMRKQGNLEKYRVYYEKEEVFAALNDKIIACNLPKCCYVWNKLYKRELVQNRMFERNVYFEDMLWLPEVLKSSEKLVTVPDVVYYYRVNTNSIVKTNNPTKQTHSYNAKKYIIKFFEENNLYLPKKYHSITKSIHYLFKMPVVKIKECGNIETFYLFGFVPFFFKKI